MPLYEYRCLSCGKVFEVMQKFSDQRLEEHADCGGSLERLVSAPALQFKGSGWYITDYARKSGGNGEKTGGPSGKDGAGESKPSESSGKSESAAPATSTPSSPSSDKK
jgi:putative FmdB family regulatory protein